MRTITCSFFAVVTLLLGDIRASTGPPGDALPATAALAFLIAAVVFAVLDWPGLPTRDVAERAAADDAARPTGRTKADE